MTTHEMRGKMPIVKSIGEYQGTTSEPNDESILFDDYSYETFRGMFTKEMYVKDINDGTFTCRDVSLDSLASVVAAEKAALRKNRAARTQKESQERYDQPTLFYSVPHRPSRRRRGRGLAGGPTPSR